MMILKQEQCVSNLEPKGAIPRPVTKYNESHRFYNRGFDRHFISNEPTLFKTFEFIKNQTGVGIGVGSDQMLDMFVNSKLDKTAIVDISEFTNLSTRFMLAVGKIHFLYYAEYPTPEEFLNYFKSCNIENTLDFVGPLFTNEDFNSLYLLLSTNFGIDKVHNYLNGKNKQSAYTSWVSSTDTLKKVIDAHLENRIIPILADLAGKHGVKELSNDLHKQGDGVSIIYLSNVLDYYSDQYNMGKIKKSLSQLPLKDDARIILTTSSDDVKVLTGTVNIQDETGPLMHNIDPLWATFVITKEDLWRILSDRDHLYSTAGLQRWFTNGDLSKVDKGLAVSQEFRL